MTNAAAIPAETAGAPPPSMPSLPAAGPVRRTAFYLPGAEGALFAWLHLPAGSQARHGILICPPVGHEQVHSHRALRHLGDALAARGFAALRLDYHGIGDSDGTGLEPGRCAAWLANIREAVNWLRGPGGCATVSLIGLRMGATLAALHAAEHEVENLVLWAPVVKGRKYVRELTALSRTARLAAEPASASTSASIEAVGFVFTEETARDLAGLDLAKHQPRFKHGLLVRGENAADEAPLFAGMETLGLPGYEEMMAEPHQTTVPRAALLAITAWLCAKTPPSPVFDVPAPFRPVEIMHTGGPAPVRESIHRLSTRPDLFGIITEPAGATPAPALLPWIVMLNAGAAYRIGPGRLHVRLARELAALGHPCLRLDISGLGDSLADPLREENDTYAATAFRDIAIVCDYLQALHPGRPVVLMGLCSGAYAAFQSAVQLPHPALIESILVNPMTFFWRDGMSIQATPNERLQAWHYYWNIIFDLDNWRQLFSRKSSNMGVKGAVQRFIQRVGAKSPAPASTGPAVAAKPAAPALEGGLAHPPKENLPADLARVAASSRRLAMFISDDDPGHFLLMYKARRKAAQLIRTGRLQCFFISNADHTFSTEAARRALSRSLTDYLRARFPQPGPEPGPAPLPAPELGPMKVSAAPPVKR